MRRLLAGTAVCLAVFQTTAALAQVGHLPENSPYKDMRIKQALVFYGGVMSGGEGNAGVGPTNGPVGGVRWEIAVGAPSILFLGLSMANLERPLVNPDDPPDTRFLDSANQRIVMVDAGLNFVLTGRKTWRGLAPYMGVGFGMAFGGSVPEDLSGYTFKTKFHIDPTIGIRFHPSPRFHFRIEGRAVFWRLNYPPRFFDGTDPLLNDLIQTNTNWTVHPTLLFGIGYTLRR
ncbi:MAG: hypothetical protein IH966_01875 [Gemmatimonadetes bacterium]|nr:hypothetical protein [Gemmatimonadota bacterium]